MRARGHSKAIFGGALEGHAPVRFIYLDEAGISAQEPVTIVAGVIIHADTKFVETENAINALFDKYVPAKLRVGFIFHSTKLYSGVDKIQPGLWAEGARWALLEGMLAIPRRLKLPVSIGMSRRGSHTWKGLKVELSDHAEALFNCLARADLYLRQYTPAHEVASMVMENIDKNRAVLESVPELLRKRPITLTASEYITKDLPGSISEAEPSGEMLIKKIRDSIYWQNKDQALFLQLADAWAFAWRLYLSSEHPNGDRVMRAAFGNVFPGRDAFPTQSGAIRFMWTPTG